MKKFIISFVLFLFPISSFGEIGLYQTKYKDHSRNRVISSFIFYPTEESPTEVFAENIAFSGFMAKKDAKISKDNLPLFLLAHGTSGNWKNTSWLAAELAKNAVVVSANFPNYTTGEASPESVLKP